MKRIFLFALVLAAALSATAGKTRKTLFVIVDGIPASCIERLQPPTIMEIASRGGYARAFCGGEVGMYNETPTISAIGYANILTGTWMDKHNVRGNSSIDENYHYPTIFKIAKQQSRNVSTAIYTSWTDNTTVLIGANHPRNDNMKVDYVFDGYDNDKVNFPDKPGDLHIFDIDSRICADAAKNITSNAPDLNWVYLWYTDDAFHLNGNGAVSDHSVLATDSILRPVWEAVKQREKQNNEEWLVIVLTDHGRGFNGYHHGGQSPWERTVWVSTNYKKLNKQFGRYNFSHTDIVPTICRFMDFSIKRDTQFEHDGIPFIGSANVYDLQAVNYDDKALLTWHHDGAKTTADIYAVAGDNYKQGTPDNWTKIATVPANSCRYTVDLKPLGGTSLYKFAIVTPQNTITKQLHK